MNLVVEKYCELPKTVRKPMWQVWHKMLIRFDKDVAVKFMNYGFENLNGHAPLSLTRGDEKDRYCIQLYDYVVNKVDLYYKDILEVGSGRGGGASYITRYYNPKSYYGLDISSNVVDFCNRYYYKDPILTFVKGEAELIPFDDESFDRIVNIESARCYGDMPKFFKEANRVLREDGYFLFADMILPENFEKVITLIKDAGFIIESKENITKNVAKSLERDSERREGLIENYIPGFLKKGFTQFAGVEGTERYDAFNNGKFQYWTFVLKKA